MLRYLPIRRVHAREVLDSRGNPTVEVEVTVGEGVVGLEGYTGRALVPSGASTGRFEAVELRDEDTERYFGKGVKKAVEHVNTFLADAIVGENALQQAWIDQLLREADGTKNKSRAGANAVLGISLAVARASAKALRIPLYQYLGGCYTPIMPIPMMNILNGGKHADQGTDFQEFMIMPAGAQSFSEALRMGTEIYQKLKKILFERGYHTAVGDEGGFAPDVSNAEEVLDLLVDAVAAAGYEPGKEVFFAIDAAASELYQADEARYYFPKESRAKCREEKLEALKQPDTICTSISRGTDEMIAYYSKLASRYPIWSIEDPLDEEDWEGWQKITKELGEKIVLVGDDLFVTNTVRLQKGIEHGCGNAILIKPNQIGTLSETMNAIRMAQQAGYAAVISHRSGETDDSLIADLAVAMHAGLIKTGAPCRGERVAKYNQLLRIEEMQGDVAVYAGEDFLL